MSTKNPNLQKKSAIIFAVLFIVFVQNLMATPQKFALVIGNGNYTNLSRLSNPVNDANDITNVLRQLGFTVDRLVNGSLDQMTDAVMRLKERLSESEDAFGFFFYAGHGVQSGGENFLIPVDANIPSDSFLRVRALSVQSVLSELNEAGNGLNVVVLDACRDNPFGWNRSGNRGLSLVARQPADSIIVFATSAGDVADDGSGRNGLFTEHFLNNLETPGLEVQEVFRRTGADVSRASSNRQIPAVYSQFFGIAYFSPTDGSVIVRPSSPFQNRQNNYVNNDAHLWTLGASFGSSFSAPWVVGTLYGTLAPIKNSFFDIGVEMGMISGETDVGFYSICPFARYNIYLPVKIGGFFIGIGAS